MNKARRKQITDLSKKLSELLDGSELEDLKGEAEQLRDDEQEYLGNMPESLQGGDRGRAAEQAVSALDTAAEALQQAFDSLNEAIAALDEAEGV